MRPQHDHGRTAGSLAGNATDRQQRMGNALPSRMELVGLHWTANPCDLFEHVQKVAMDVSRSPSTLARAADVLASRGTLLQRVGVS